MNPWMRIRWFGKPWPQEEVRAPICDDDALRVDTPAGELCLLCDEPIREGDRGVVMSAAFIEPNEHVFWLSVDGGNYRPVCAEHIDCHIAHVVPDMAHLVERRPC
jgi:hypothetical protein